METTDILARCAHDVGIAAWFGGALMGVAAVNRAGTQPLTEKGNVSTELAASRRKVWDAWTPLNAAAIGLHLAGGAALLRANASRMSTQRGVATVSNAKLAVTIAALAASGYARLLSQQQLDYEKSFVPKKAESDADGDAHNSPSTTSDTSDSSVRQLEVLQWLVPGLTGLIIITASILGEQQRPAAVAHGVLQRLTHGLQHGLQHGLPHLPHLSAATVNPLHLG
jgi:hypothetical protein